MEIIEPEVSLWGEIPLDLKSTLKWIERAGRTCYNSLDKINRYSACYFVTNVLKPVPPHASVLEHSNLVLRSKYSFRDPVAAQKYQKGRIYSNFIFTGIHHDHVYVYGNWRAFYEMGKKILPDLNFFNFPEKVERFFPRYEVITEPEDVPYFAQAVTVCFVTDRAVSHEIVRHRHKCAYSQRSQRYCSESDLKIIKPVWFDKAHKDAKKTFLLSCMRAEDDYRTLKKYGYTSQDARVVLPNATATTIVVSAYLSEWDWIKYLRTGPGAYSPIRKLIQEAWDQMIEARIMDPE